MITLTALGAAKAGELRDREGRPELFLRIGVSAGGCSGLRYQLFFDDQARDGDYELDVEYPGGVLEIRVDQLSAPYLQGATLDYVDSIQSQGFVFDNPNATGGCACGDSFH